MSELHQKNLKELSQLLATKTISSLELNQHFIQRIKKYNPQIQSFLHICEEQAFKSAQESDDRRSKDATLSILDGIPLAHKDLFCTQSIPTTAASKMLENFIPSYNATIVEKLNQTGTTLLGKLSMDEFAMGSSNEHSAFGSVQNPWNLAHVPGGSSGGSAAAVAARLTPFATGSDTGGSIRQPAAYCGVTGIKPTYGTCSRWGMIAFASSLDQAGPIAKTAEDCAIILNHMAGFDSKDSTSSQKTTTVFDSQLEKPLQGVTIGLPQSYFNQLNETMKTAIEEAIKTYEKLGATIKKIDLPNSDIAIATYYLIASAEASSNLERYDGVRYGYRCENPKDLQDLYQRSRSEGFGEEVKRRIMIGSYALSAGYYDAYYEQARRGRRAILNSFQNAFKDCDLILSPTTPSPAFELNSKSKNPATMYLEDLYTVSVNLAGLPAISHPAGFINHLPIGCQLIGPHFSEPLLLNAVHLYQKETDFHQKSPNNF